MYGKWMNFAASTHCLIKQAVCIAEALASYFKTHVNSSEQPCVSSALCRDSVSCLLISE